MSRSPRCQLTIVASQQLGFHFTLPIMRLTESAEQIIGQRPGLHFTLPITPMPDGSDELITPLSADNR
ncbi:hypothetical protein ACK37A_11310, partial [Aeromonas veronii]